MATSHQNTGIVNQKYTINSNKRTEITFLVNDNNGDSMRMLRYDAGGGRETTLSLGVALLYTMVVDQKVCL